MELIEVVFFDFGGVLAEEGFRDGLLAIAKREGLDPQQFLKTAVDLTFNQGFVTARIDEQNYLRMLRQATGIKSTDESLREEVLSRFVLRPWMIDIVKRLKERNIRTAILSDQTKWLDELNREHSFFNYFERVFNSYYLGMCKRDPEIFDFAAKEMGVKPEQALLIDDNQGNVDRAQQKGLKVIYYQTREEFEKDLYRLFPLLLDQ